MAQRILKEMGVLQELIAEKKTCFAQSGGIVSPKGYNFIGNSAAELQMGDEGVACAIKRQHLDEKIAYAARKAGVDLRENHKVVEALFDHYTGTWLVKTEDDQDASIKHELRCRILVCADGSTSVLARQLGIVEGEPQAVCSRQYVAKGTHAFADDGVCFYPGPLLPGYVALFREADGDCNFLTYIIPGGSAKNDELKEIHETLAKNDPFISKALGPNFQGEPMRAAPLRLGGVPKSFDRHCLVIGDAAGMIDPLSGEGIHHSMHSGKVAAKVLAEAVKKQDFSSRQLKKYQTLWEADFAADFYWSRVACSVLVKYPWVLDAAAIVIKKKGGKFLTDWAQVMTGSKSKFWLLRPDVAGPFAWEIFLESFRSQKSK
jgi:flavin-dependent dehydrogenase